MNSCKEFVLDDLMAIVAIPVSDYNVGAEAWQVKAVIPATGFSPTLTNSITIGLQTAVSGGTLIPIMRASGKAKDSESDSVAGRKHSVSVQCEADDRESSVWNDLLTLERTPCHLLLTFRDGPMGFVAADRDSYLCTVSRDDGKVSLAFRIQNLTGIQTLV